MKKVLGTMKCADDFQNIVMGAPYKILLDKVYDFYTKKKLWTGFQLFLIIMECSFITYKLSLFAILYIVIILTIFQL